MKINSYQNNINKPYGDLTTKLAKQALTPQRQQAAETALNQMGVSATETMKKAYSIYAESGLNPSTAEMKATSDFLNKAKGSDAAKLETVAVASLKGLDITEENLSAVHSALNDASNDTLTIEGLTPELKEQAMPEALKSLKLKMDQLPPAVRQRLLQTLTVFGMSSSEAEGALADITSGSTVAYLQLKAILPEAVMAKIEASLQIEGLKQQLEQGLALTAQLSPETKEGLQNLEVMAESLSHMQLPNEETLKAWLNQLSQEKLQDVMTVLMARMADTEGDMSFGAETSKPMLRQDNDSQGEISEPQDHDDDPVQFFEKLENWLDESLTLMASGYGSEQALQVLSGDLKRFVVAETTVEMVKVKAEFDSFKAKSLTQLETALNSKPEETAQIVTKVAERLDHLIMHTDLSLYTDMKTERKFMGLSAELQQIAAQAQAQPEEALGQLKELTKKLEALVFNPTREKVVVKLSEKAEQRMDLQLKSAIEPAAKEEITSPRLIANGSAKGVLELFRQLGLNREPELMDELFSAQSDFIGKTEEKKETFKELLLQLTKTEEGEDEQLIKAVEKGIAHLTGQQLLNRPDRQQDSQSLFFNIPLEHQNQEMKLFVKARKTANRMDWENCSLYVLVDLKQYGETGIRVNASAKQLSVTISNESPDIMQVMRPVAENMLKELEEVGYLPSELKYSPFMRQKPSDWIKPSQEAQANASVKPDFSKGGFEWQV